MNTNERLAALGISVPDLLLPAAGTDLSKWAVIACDQHTQDRCFWQSVQQSALNSPSTLNLIFPEVYLEDADKQDRITSIHHTMNEYISMNDNGGIFAPPKKTFVYVERDTPFNKGRLGIVLALDLEHYDWKPGSAPMIRPTEGTVPERLPPRMEIRRGAPLELPHILILIADKDNTLLPLLGEQAKARQDPLLYDTDLMLNAGHLKGWALDTEADWETLASGMEKLASESPFLYAVGDGNHSLATAKAIWVEFKEKGDAANHGALMNHPLRWALVEVENLYDPALTFEPIHRILKSTDKSIFNDLQNVLLQLPGCRCRKICAQQELASLVEDDTVSALRFGLVIQGECLLFEADPVPLAVKVIGPLVDDFATEHCKKINIDYIHGKDALFRLSSEKGTAGIFLPPFRKQGLFETIATHGPLPRKSFSMGEACEKRFYFECRRIKQ